MKRAKLTSSQLFACSTLFEDNGNKPHGFCPPLKKASGFQGMVVLVLEEEPKKADLIGNQIWQLAKADDNSRES